RVRAGGGGPMKYAAVFAALACYLGVLAVALGGWAYLLSWPAGAFLLFAAAYAGARPGLLGKRPDGRLAWWSFVLFCPALALLWGVWHLARRPRPPAACGGGAWGGCPAPPPASCRPASPWSWT